MRRIEALNSGGQTSSGNGTAGSLRADLPVLDGVSATSQEAQTVSCRRFRRRLLKLGMVSLLVLLVGFSARHAILSSALPTVLSAVFSDQLGMPVSIERAILRPQNDGSLVLELRRVEIGPPAEVDVGSFSPPPPLPLTAATIDRVQVQCQSLWSLRGGLETIQAVEVGELSIDLQSTPQNSADSNAWDEVPELVITSPSTLPTIPFPLRVIHCTVRQGARVFAGSIRSTRGAEGLSNFEVALTSISGMPGLEAGQLLWVPTGHSSIRIEASLEPMGLEVVGGITCSERGWQIQVSQVNAPGTLATFSCALPAQREEALDFSLHVQSYVSSELLVALGVESSDLVPALHALRLDGSGQGNRWSASGILQTEVGQLDLEATIDQSESRRQLTAGVSAIELPLGLIATPWLNGLQPQAIGDLELWFEWQDGPPVIGGSFDLTDAQVDLGGEQPLEIYRWATLLNHELGGPIEVGASVLELPNGMVLFDGEIPTTPSQQWSGEVAARDFDLEKLAEAFDLSGLRGVRGNLELRGSVNGRLDDPKLSFEGRLRGGEFAPQGWERIREIDADLAWNGTTIDAQRLSARIGGGTVQGDGRLRLGAGGIEQFDSLLQFDSVRLIRTGSMRIRGRGALQFSGTPEQPTVAGEIAIVRGIYDQDIHPSLSVSSGRTNLPFDLFRFPDGFLSRLGFDVSLDLLGNFEVRNNRVKVAPFGVLHLGGNGFQPVLTGAITASSGELLLPRITFEIQNVEVRFPEDDPFHPRVEFSGRGMTRGIEINARADGDLFSPEVTFSSSPSYPEEDLLLLVATGRLRSQIESSDMGVLAATELARLYGPQVWGSIFGSDGAGAGIFDRVEVGARASDETGVLDTVTVELKINDWISLLAEQDSDGESTADLQFFWWFP